MTFPQKNQLQSAGALILCFCMIAGARLADAANDGDLNPPGDPKNPAGEGPSAYKRMRLEELMSIDITTVTRSPEKLSQSASAVQVITGEDIHRSGALSLADALRLAPNLEVQQVNALGWVVSARGFDALFANKLLVLIDGRSVYTALDAGVFWDAQNVLLEDIDRIEVVSGPGGTLWGANAVNGIINILTKSARDTQGLYVSGGGGSFIQDFGAVRYGDSIGSNFFFRVYGQRFDRNSSLLPNGSDSLDSWNMNHGGFRADYYPSDANNFTLQGDFYSGTEFNAPTAESKLAGQNVLGRWTRTFSEESDFSLQLYFDRTWREDIPSTISDELVTYDIDFQHRLPIGARQTFMWGAGYRFMQDDTPTSTPIVGFVPQKRDMHLASAFLQDEVVLVPDRLKVTLGSKFEHNEFSGFEIQPSIRAAWTPGDKHTVWGAISRAVRSPSRIDVDYHIPKTAPYLIGGGPDFESEKVIAYELGYRVQPFQTLSLSLAAFYNDYDDIYSVEASPLDPSVFTIQNGLDGQSWGVELSGTYQPFERWRLRGGYTYFHKDLWDKPGHNVTPAVVASLGNDPEHQFILQSILDLPGHFQFDVVARFVDALPNPAVSSYFTFDARIAWEYKHWEIALVGQNLWDDSHPEFSPAQEIPRSIFGKISFKW